MNSEETDGEGDTVNIAEKIRVRYKIKKLVCGMLRNMSYEDAVETTETIKFCLRQLPKEKKEELLDRLNGVIQDVESV